MNANGKIRWRKTEARLEVGPRDGTEDDDGDDEAEEQKPTWT